MSERKPEPVRVTVVLPPALVRLFPGSVLEVELDAADVDGMMNALNLRWPGMRDRLCDSRPSVRRHINVFVEGERAGLDTPLVAGGTVYVLTAMSGG